MQNPRRAAVARANWAEFLSGRDGIAPASSQGVPAPLSSLDVETPLGFRVVCSAGYWHRITTAKHPVMRDRLASVHQTLADPDEVRRSMYDDDVLLFHRRSGERWICAVVKRTGNMGYLITAYPADRIKRGELLWTR